MPDESCKTERAFLPDLSRNCFIMDRSRRQLPCFSGSACPKFGKAASFILMLPCKKHSLESGAACFGELNAVNDPNMG